MSGFPITEDDYTDISEQTSGVTIDVLANDTDPDGGALTLIAAVVSSGTGIVEVSSTNVLIYNSYAVGADVITYTVQNTFGNTSQGYVYINVMSSGGGGGTGEGGTYTNSVPTAYDDYATTFEGSPVAVNVLANDTDPDIDLGVGDALHLNNAVVTNGNAEVTIVGNDIVVLPLGTGAQDIVVNYTIGDNYSGSSQAGLFVTVNALDNNAPIAQDDVALTDEITAINIDVLANDSDPEGDILTVTNAVIQVGTGDVVVNEDNTLTFTPTGSGAEDVVVSYTISDGQLSATAEVNITITPTGGINHAPIANDEVVMTSRETAITVNVLENDTDLDGDTLDIVGYQLVSGFGEVVVNADKSITFTPATGFAGDALIDYTVVDSSSLSATASLIITVKSDIVGNDADNYLEGYAVDDFISGMGGNDSLYGSGGNDRLEGGRGKDYLQGDSGNDTYIFNLGDGQDTLYNFDSDEYYNGVTSIDKLIFGAGITAADITFFNVGNSTEDLVIGIKGTTDSITVQYYFNSSMAYELDAIEFADGTVWDKAAISVLARVNMRVQGTVGGDVLNGGMGDDTFIVNHARDVVMENVGSGIDTVEASISFSLGENLENLTLKGNANLSGIGNGMSNIITGNEGNNRLLGGDGNDTLSGLSGGDTLNGGAGADSMSGSLGNDTFTVENAADVVIELANEGFDTVNSFISYTLNANIERLSLEGFASLDGTGNELDNVLNGNNANNHLVGGAGDDTLQGKGGADLLEGGLGNDVYYVDNSGDTVQELADEGVDKVSSNISYTLTANVEQLFFTGIAGLTGLGNTLNNVIYGNDGNNKLSGDAGNDSLNGGLGNDSLKGGTGSDTLVGGLANDIYSFAVGDGHDVINNTDAGNGNDKVLFEVGIGADQLWLRQLGNDLEISIIGRADSIKVQNWYSDEAKRVDSFELAAGNVLLASEVQNLVAAMSAFTPPSMGQTSLTSAQHQALDVVIATNWESLTGTA